MFGFGDNRASRWQYQKLRKNDEKGTDQVLPPNGNEVFDGAERVLNLGRASSAARMRRGTASFYRPIVVVLVSINILLSMILLWVIILVVGKAPHQPEAGVQHLGQAEIPVETELYRFRTGVREKTPFFGAPNASTDAAWSTILKAGLVKLTPKQASKLSAPTARSQHDPTSYVGILEVMHQLHCLHYLRSQVYTSKQETHVGELFHIAHCFEYIRQSLMCLADVNIAPIGWSEKKHEYTILWDTVRQCRNFEKIHQWAVDEENHEDEEV